MMSSSLALISCNAAFREGRGWEGGMGQREVLFHQRKVWEDVQREREREEWKENGTYGRKVWEEKRERMVQRSM